MKAIVQRGYGTTSVLSVREVARPEVEADSVVIRVRAASLNHADVAIMRGEPYLLRLAFGLRTPRSSIRGRDVAGVVEEVGAAVTGFRPGDEVYGEIDTGSLAAYARVRAAHAALAPKPPSLSFEQAAAVPLAAGAALQGLRDAGGLRAGQRVLVNGASGGVGTFAVQIAKAIGAHVTGVCSARNVDLVRSLGADHVVDYAREDFATGGRRYDLILDVAGSRSLAECRRALTDEGTLVLTSGAGGRWFGPIGRILRAVTLSPFVRQRLRPLVSTLTRADLVTLTELVEAGRLTPAIERTYPLEEALEAFRAFDEERARAKLVVSV